jgi:hypothetical protein
VEGRDLVERAPRGDLAQHVLCVWSGASPSDAPCRVLPDGCVDILWAPGRHPWVAGPDTTAKCEMLPPGPRVGIRFRPGAAPAVLGLPASELRDLRVSLADLWPAGPAARLSDALAGAGTIEARFRALEAAVDERARRAGPPDPRVTAVVARLLRPADARGAPPPGDLAGERQLRRRFTDAVGYAPKVFERVMRLQRFLGLARAAPGARLADLALAAGYADQAHLTRECRRLAGLTPAVLRGA